MLLVKNLFTQEKEDWREKLDKKSIDKKHPELDEKMWKENITILSLFVPFPFCST